MQKLDQGIKSACGGTNSDDAGRGIRGAARRASPSFMPLSRR